MLIAFGVQGLYCLKQMSDESVVLKRLLKDPEKGKKEWEELHLPPKVRRNHAHTWFNVRGKKIRNRHYK